MERNLYDSLQEATLIGCVSTLNSLIQKDPLILDRVSYITSFTETPLHIATLRGHQDFVNALLNHNPKFATILDSFGRSPLHLAAAEGHVEIAHQLLDKCPRQCLVRDEDGRTPLHLAVVNEQIEVMKFLIERKPEMVMEKLGNGEENILHLCVKHDCLRALKLLMERYWGESDGIDEFVNAKDNNGDTILHLSVALRQVEAIKYLLSKRGINANALDKKGFTAVDLLKYCPRDFISLEIEEILVEAGVQSAKDLREFTSLVISSGRAPSSETWTITNAPKLIFNAIKNHYTKSSETNWLEESHGNLMVAATVTTTMAFQAGLNPPGGFWQSTDILDKNITFLDGTNQYFAGDSIAATAYIEEYKSFLKYNTASLVASLSIILLMISGFPLKNKVSTCLLLFAMCTTIVFNTLTYLVSLFILTPDKTFYATMTVNKCSLHAWIGLCAIVILHHTLHFLVWATIKLRKFVLGQ